MLEVGTLFLHLENVSLFWPVSQEKKVVWDLQNISSYGNEGRVALGLWNFRPQ